MVLRCLERFDRAGVCAVAPWRIVLNQALTAPPEMRIRRYREMAAEAFRLAGYTRSAEVNIAFLNLARSWSALADQVERQALRLGEAGLVTPESADDARRVFGFSQRQSHAA